MGSSRSEMRDRLISILEFSDLQRFQDARPLGPSEEITEQYLNAAKK